MVICDRCRACFPAATPRRSTPPPTPASVNSSTLHTRTPQLWRCSSTVRPDCPLHRPCSPLKLSDSHYHSSGLTCTFTHSHLQAPHLRLFSNRPTTTYGCPVLMPHTPLPNGANSSPCPGSKTTFIIMRHGGSRSREWLKKVSKRERKLYF